MLLDLLPLQQQAPAPAPARPSGGGIHQPHTGTVGVVHRKQATAILHVRATGIATITPAEIPTVDAEDELMLLGLL